MQWHSCNFDMFFKSLRCLNYDVTLNLFSLQFETFISVKCRCLSEVVVVISKFIELMTSRGQSADHWHQYYFGIKYSLKSHLVLLVLFCKRHLLCSRTPGFTCFLKQVTKKVSTNFKRTWRPLSQSMVQ